MYDVCIVETGQTSPVTKPDWKCFFFKDGVSLYIVPTKIFVDLFYSLTSQTAHTHSVWCHVAHIIEFDLCMHGGTTSEHVSHLLCTNKNYLWWQNLLEYLSMHIYQPENQPFLLILPWYWTGALCSRYSALRVIWLHVPWLGIGVTLEPM